MARYEKLTAPSQGTPIRFENGHPIVPNDPIIPFIRGDGTGVDIWPATQKVLDAAVAKAYGDERRIEWFKVYAGDEACDLYGTYQYLPEDTLEAIRTYGVAIKGPLTTPIGGGIRSLNVALRQIFDLYCCVRPCRYYEGTPSPHKRPQDLDVIVYRGHLHGDRMGGQRSRLPRVDPAPQYGGDPGQRQARQAPDPGWFRHWHQAGEQARQPAPHP
jgi:isocitrate dehydrogenase